MADKEFMGRGMKFPPQINPATGRFVTASEEELIRQSIYLILSTQIMERPLRPGFGSDINSLAFMDINVSNVNLIVRSVQSAIMEHEPRVDDVRVMPQAGGLSGTVLFSITYTIRATQSVDSMVYPFYLNMTPQEEEEGEVEEYEPQTIEEVDY